MKFKSLAAMSALVIVAGCGKGEVELENASVEEVVKASANAQALNPGQWANTTRIVSVEMPGMPQAEKAMMDRMTQAMIGQVSVQESCVTPEQAKKPDAGLFAGQGQRDCTFDKFELGKGAMNAVLSCNPGGQTTMKMKMSGAYGGDSYDLDSEMEIAGATGMPGRSGMKVKAKSSGKRTGDCKPV